MGLFLRFFSNIYDNKKSLLISIFLVSILFSLFFLLFFKNIGPSQQLVPGTDYLNFYEPVANSILQGKGIPVKEFLGIKYPPGYPLFLVIIFKFSQLTAINKMALIIIFNVIITALGCCFLFLLTDSIFGKRIALISSILWLSYPFNLWLIKNPNTEVPFILLFYFALWIYLLALKSRSVKLALLSGVLLGLAALIRPIIIFLPPFLAVLIFFLLKDLSFNKRFIISSILLIGYLLAISPWLAYVYKNTGNLIMLSASGSSSTISSSLTFLVDKSKVVYEDKAWEKFSPPKDIVDLIERSRIAKMDTFGGVAHFFLQELRSHPVTFFKLLAIKMARSWYATSEMWLEKQILLLQSPYLISGLVGLILFFKKLKDKMAYLFFLLTVIFYFWALATATFSILRYMIPAMGLLIVFSAITVSAVLDKLNKHVFFSR